MFHIPITDGADIRERIEFSHIIDDTADERTWKNDRNITLDNIKINVFVNGDFSLIVENMSFKPVYGDFCILPPRMLHYGRVIRKTKLDYYQIDIGVNAFDGIPGGHEMLSELSELYVGEDVFVRPSQSESKLLLDMTSRLEGAIARNDITLAFAYCVEVIAKMKELSKAGKKGVVRYLSPHTSSAVAYIEQNYHRSINIAEISEVCKISRSYLTRKFKEEIGVSVHDYVTNLRILKATQLLGEKSVAETAFLLGFCDSSHFISVFKKVFGMTPTEYIGANRRAR